MKGRGTYGEWLGLIILSFFIFHLSPSFARMNVECVGKATQVVNGGDTLFIFGQSIGLRTGLGEVDWYSTADTSTPAYTNTDEIYPDEGGYYIVKDGVQYEPFYVFLCPDAGAVSMTVEPGCTNTVLRLSGDTKPFAYTRPDGTSGSCARTCSVEYNALAWSGEAWADSLVQDTLKMAATINLPALYGATSITLCADAMLRDTLDLSPVCVSDTLEQDSLKAISFQLQSLATIRGEKGEKSNEMNRPTDQKIITATTTDDYSGALEVAFYSNPTPAVRFYRWTIYKASQVIATRNDQDIRYTFSEPGNYRVVCSVANDICAVDSSEMKVNISESYLRVPNVFTPDGNGKNDEFRVAYRSLREFHCWVYNRWGKLVYEWTDPAKGWDGTINGRPAAEGAYFYVIRAMGTDAPKDADYVGLKAVYKSKKQTSDESVVGIYQLSGDINLLRGKK